MARFAYSADPAVAPQPPAGPPANGKIIYRIRTAGGHVDELRFRPGEIWEVNDPAMVEIIRRDPKIVEVP